MRSFRLTSITSLSSHDSRICLAIISDHLWHFDQNVINIDRVPNNRCLHKIHLTYFISSFNTQELLYFIRTDSSQKKLYTTFFYERIQIFFSSSYFLRKTMREEGIKARKDSPNVSVKFSIIDFFPLFSLSMKFHTQKYFNNFLVNSLANVTQQYD